MRCWEARDSTGGAASCFREPRGRENRSLAAHFLRAACERGERCVYFAFEESSQQIVRNMRSIGVSLEPWVKKGLLHIHSIRPSSLGLEAHLESMHRALRESAPALVVIDPITNLIGAADKRDIKSMLTRLIDYIKLQGITAMFTHLSSAGHGGHLESTDEGISSLMDAWVLLRDRERNGQRSYGIYVLKARGMAHSHEIRRFRLTNQGIRIEELMRGPSRTETVHESTASS